MKTSTVDNRLRSAAERGDITELRALLARGVELETRDALLREGLRALRAFRVAEPEGEAAPTEPTQSLVRPLTS